MASYMVTAICLFRSLWLHVHNSLVLIMYICHLMPRFAGCHRLPLTFVRILKMRFEVRLLSYAASPNTHFVRSFALHFGRFVLASWGGPESVLTQLEKAETV